MKTAVIYYSKSGTTEKIAEKIRERLQAEIFFVEPDVKYGNRMSVIAQVGREKLTGHKAGYMTKPLDFAGYDLVFAGFPIWYGTMPSFFADYLRDCSFGDTPVVPFAAAGGNGKEKALADLKAICPNIDTKNYLFHALLKKADVDRWLDRVKKQYQK